MKRLLIRFFGAVWFCSMFHTAYGTPDKKWHCKKCKLTYDRRPSDNYIGSM